MACKYQFSLHWKTFGKGDFQDLEVINSISFHEVINIDRRSKDVLIFYTNAIGIDQKPRGYFTISGLLVKSVISKRVSCCFLGARAQKSSI